MFFSTFLFCSKGVFADVSNTKKYLLYGGVVLFLVLIIILILLRVRSRSRKKTLSKAERISFSDESQDVMSLGVELVVQKGDDQGKQFALQKRSTSIGRAGARKNDIELIDDTVSKQQATILCDIANRQFFINNESTTNTTKVNGRIITEMTVLKSGDMIEMGNTVLLFKKNDS